MSLLHFCALIVVISLLSMDGQRALRFHQKYLNLVYEDERRTYRFGTTWECVINDRIHFWVNYPFKGPFTQDVASGGITAQLLLSVVVEVFCAFEALFILSPASLPRTCWLCVLLPKQTRLLYLMLSPLYNSVKRQGATRSNCSPNHKRPCPKSHPKRSSSESTLSRRNGALTVG